MSTVCEYRSASFFGLERGGSLRDAATANETYCPTIEALRTTLTHVYARADIARWAVTSAARSMLNTDRS